MSVEIWLHPSKATKKQLREFLSSRGFVECDHIMPWGKGAVHYHWFECRDFLSYDGVEATIYKPDEDHRKLGECAWALHTRTRTSGSPADKQFQIDTINIARRQFGGNFYNDWGGKNRHMTAPAETRDAPSRGLYLSYENVSNHISSVQYALPAETEGMKNLAGTPLAAMAQMDPSRVIYNAIVPFAVASLEGFFGDAFEILIEYDADAQAYLSKQSKKVEFEDVREISAGSKTIEDVIAGWYSFQNPASMQRAFSEWLDIDFRRILRNAVSPHNPEIALDEALESIVAMRHRVIHGLKLNLALDRDATLRVLDDTQAIIDAFVNHLETQRGLVVREAQFADGQPEE